MARVLMWVSQEFQGSTCATINIIISSNPHCDTVKVTKALSASSYCHSFADLVLPQIHIFITTVPFFIFTVPPYICLLYAGAECLTG